MKEKLKQLVRARYFNEDGEPFEMTEGQTDIFSCVAQRKYPRVEIRTYTQYGKSDIISLGLLTRITTFPEKYSVISGSDKKLSIIRGYLIGHIFDNDFTLSCFDIEKGESLERIRRERNKNHLTFKVGDRIGEVFFISAEGKRTREIIAPLLGFGSRNIIVDDSPLLSDEHYAGIIRMLGGHKDNMLIELGNAINRNHFLKTSRDPNYKHIIVNYQQGIQENRQRPEFFEEIRRKMGPIMFSSLYECVFPPQNAIDSRGYMILILEEELDRVYVDNLDIFGEKKLGVDVAGGGRNKSTIVLRGINGAKVLYCEQNDDTMSLVSIICKFKEQEEISWYNIFVDSVGIGKGLADRLNEVAGVENEKITSVNFGEKARQNDFLNLRAECYWLMAQDIKQGLKLIRHPGWEELLSIKYKIQSDKKVKLMSKEEMLKDGVMSPDVADALALTYQPIKVFTSLSTEAIKPYYGDNEIPF